MEKNQFEAILPIISSSIVERIQKELNITEKDAIREFYSSHLYELLEQEETKIWQYSTEKLFEMFLEEKDKGKITFPQV
ncbi:hypothetical protein ABG79_01655 [Caloramator mitchellensis]|uniref:Uncharacterized protein n=1 Tax=Caloramator mitchellensis TaxID=908809 RepID=A0A0R3K0K9_CALMK|nr:hypothetical protein [Caloramator mitchellensis]KRQ86453.1 hypothetical protein ABG79_01655 [Caloramator mitchellensis]